MIEVRVRQQDVAHIDVGIPDGSEQLVDLIARIDQDRFTGAFTSDDKPILVKRRDRPSFEDHVSMILCVMDDLMFSIKISSTAKAIGGIDVFFERSPDMVLPRIHEKQPALVIFDLNSARMNPLAALAAMKQDPGLAGIRTLGFVSHVDSETIAAARAAGIDQVLARSAFSAQLGSILTGA